MDILTRENAVPAEVDTTNWSAAEYEEYLFDARKKGLSVYIELDDGTRLYSCDATHESIGIAVDGIVKYTKEQNNKNTEQLSEDKIEYDVKNSEPKTEDNSNVQPTDSSDGSLRDFQATTNKMAELIEKNIEYQSLSEKYKQLNEEYRNLISQLKQKESSNSNER